MRRAITIAAVALCAFTGRATQLYDFKLRVDGKPITGGEVCFYRTADGQSENVIDRFFYTNETRCLPADSLIEIPPGRFIAYARVGSQYVGAFRAEISGQSDANNPKDQYQSLVLDLEPAGFVD